MKPLKSNDIDVEQLKKLNEQTQKQINNAKMVCID